MAKKIKSKGFFINCFQCLKLIFKLERKMLFIYIFLTLFYAILWVLQVVSMQSFFDTAANLHTKPININSIFMSLFGMGLVYVIYHFMDGIDNCYPEIVKLRIDKHLNKLIFNRVGLLNTIEFEDTARLDFINKAVAGSQKLMWVCLTLLDIIFYYTAYFIFMGWYLFMLKPILAVSIIVVFVPCVISQLVRVTMFKNLEELSSPLRREAEYYENCLTGKEYFKETRLLGITNFFCDLFTTAIKKLNHITFLVQLKKNIINLILNIVTVTGYGTIVYILFLSVMKQEISIGAFAAVLTSIGSLYRFMNKLISERVGWATENIGSVENYLDFINEPVDEKENIPRPLNFDIKLEGVSFKYPMTDKKALDNIDLIIHNGETLAIVGENGSGKTTLCRIIMGLYPSSDGKVYYGDTPVTALNKDYTSAVFQKYCQYKMSLKDNVVISQMGRILNNTEVTNVCEKAGVSLKNETYVCGLDTILGREFNGTDLSGGQWQRVAIARCLYRESDLVILDEPTAAIDPLEETRLYNDFSEICRDKTAIIVTHRLGSVKLADRIIVLKDGRIIQDGKHSELIKIDGEYKKMYNSQKKWYLEIN